MRRKTSTDQLKRHMHSTKPANFDQLAGFSFCRVHFTIMCTPFCGQKFLRVCIDFDQKKLRWLHGHAANIGNWDSLDNLIIE